MLYALIALCGILSFISARNPYFPLKLAAGFSWWAFLFYWLSAEIVPRGTPTDIAIMGVLIMLGLMFMLWGVAGRKGSMDVEDEVSSTGGVTRRISRYTAPRETKQSSSLTNSSNLEYRQTVRKAARGSGKPRRRK